MRGSLKKIAVFANFLFVFAKQSPEIFANNFAKIKCLADFLENETYLGTRGPLSVIFYVST